MCINNSYRFVRRAVGVSKKSVFKHALKTAFFVMLIFGCACMSAHRHNQSGVAALSKGDYDKAILDFTKAISGGGSSMNVRLDYGEGNINVPMRFIFISNRAAAYVQKGDYELAIADFSEAISMTPRHHFLYFQRGIAHFRKEDYESAIADFSEAILLAPDDNPVQAAYHFERAEAHLQNRNYDLAIADLEFGLEKDPRNPAARRNLEMIRELRGIQ